MPKPLDQDFETWFAELCENEYNSLKRRAISCLAVYGKAAIPYADDVVQRTFLKAWELGEEFATKESPVGWLYKALTLTAKEVNRENNRWQRTLMKMSNLVFSGTGVEYQLKIELQSLMTAEEYELLKRLYIDNETYAELSEELNIKLSTLAMRVKRLKERVMEDYEE